MIVIPIGVNHIKPDIKKKPKNIGDPELDVIRDINAAATPRPSSLRRTGSQSPSRSGSWHSYAHLPSVPATPPTKSKAALLATPPDGTSASGRGWFFEARPRRGRLRSGGGFVGLAELEEEGAVWIEMVLLRRAGRGRRARGSAAAPTRGGRPGAAAAAAAADAALWQREHGHHEGVRADQHRVPAQPRRHAAFSPTFSQFGSSPISLASPISMASSTPSFTPYSGVSTSPPHSSSPSPKPPVSLQSASLGRAAAISPVVSAAAASPVGGAGAGTMHRNSFGDLKIPARISQAQVGLRRDLSMQTLVAEVQGILDMHVLHPSQLKEKEKESRVSSPTFKRHRSNTSSSNPTTPSPQETQQAIYKQLASALYTINSKYRISWKCAELLIELGVPSTSTSAPAMQSVGGGDGLRSGKSKARERAITLQDDAKACHSRARRATWRALTGRSDLSQRQLLLLEEMLGNPVPGGPDESLGAEDGMLTVTLSSEECGVRAGGTATKEKKRRSSREGRSDAPGADIHNVPTNGKGRRAKTSADPESSRSNHRPLSPFEPSPLKTASPRRPSLAPIFRIRRGKIPPTRQPMSLENVQAGMDLYPTFSGISGGRESASSSTGRMTKRIGIAWRITSDVEAAALAWRGGATIPAHGRRSKILREARLLGRRVSRMSSM
ncbi:hypothetical protein FB451DRAFT_1561231 [Mycena latifolia]|nr:hypothetical protein FB451DRAFT_1561231 [Mycena latifolia]